METDVSIAFLRKLKQKPKKKKNHNNYILQKYIHHRWLESRYIDAKSNPNHKNITD